MINPEAEKPWREEDVLPTPHFEVIDEVKVDKTDKGARMPVINAKNLQGEDSQFVFIMYNLPFNLRSDEGFRSAVILSAQAESLGIEVRYGKPIDREAIKAAKGELAEVPLKQDGGVGLYIERKSITKFALAAVAHLFEEEVLDKWISTEKGLGDFKDRLKKVAHTIPRFYRQMRLPLDFSPAS